MVEIIKVNDSVFTVSSVNTVVQTYTVQQLVTLKESLEGKLSKLEVQYLSDKSKLETKLSGTNSLLDQAVAAGIVLPVVSGTT